MESSPRIERTLPTDEWATPDIEPPHHGLRPAVIRAFLASVLILVPLCAGLGFVVLTASALAYARPTWSGGLWATIGRSSFVVVYAGVGLAGGAVFGVTLALSRVVGVAEARLCRWLDRLPVALFEQRVPAIPVAALREDARMSVERLYEATVARFRLPASIARRLHAMFRFRLAEDLVRECERAGVKVIGFPLVRDWLMKVGISLGFQPLRRRLRMTRRLVLVLLVLLVLIPFALLLLEGVALLPPQ